MHSNYIQIRFRPTTSVSVFTGIVLSISGRTTLWSDNHQLSIQRLRKTQRLQKGVVPVVGDRCLSHIVTGTLFLTFSFVSMIEEFYFGRFQKSKKSRATSRFFSPGKVTWYPNLEGKFFVCLTSNQAWVPLPSIQRFIFWAVQFGAAEITRRPKKAFFWDGMKLGRWDSVGFLWHQSEKFKTKNNLSATFCHIQAYPCVSERLSWLCATPVRLVAENNHPSSETAKDLVTRELRSLLDCGKCNVSATSFITSVPLLISPEMSSYSRCLLLNRWELHLSVR